MILLKNLFDIEYGQHEYNNKSSLKNGSTPLISSQGKNNGCYGFFDIKPKYKKPVITIPRTGSIGFAFVQDEPCCVDDNCLVLIPKKKMPIEDLFQVAYLLRANKWRFMYGRQITPDRIGHLDYASIYLKNRYSQLYKKIMPLKKEQKFHSEIKMRGFKLDEIFKVERGKGKYFSNCRPGKTPIISATSQNNGIIGYVDLEPTFNTPAITLERIKGNAFVQLYDFVTVPDDIFVLIPKKYPDVEFLIFCASQISKISWRFNYARKITPNRIENIKISIPVVENNEPNIEVIKDFISKIFGSDKILKNQ